MIELTDEILNKYIDRELESGDMRRVQEQLKNSEIDRKRLAALQAVHKELKKMKTIEVKNGFTSLVMDKVIRKVKAKKKDRLFIFSVSSIFLILSLAIIGYALVLIVGSSTGGNADNQSINNYINYFVHILNSAKELLTSQNISIIGSIFSLGLLITGYFFFENLRQSKRRLSKLH